MHPGTSSSFSQPTRHKRIFWLVSLLFFSATALLFSAVLAGCRPAPAPQPTPPSIETAAPRPVIGLALSNLSNPFFQDMQTGAEEAANRLGVDLLIMDAADDPELQRQQIQDMIAQGVKALLINPVGSDEVGTAIQAANDAGVPVFTLDRSAAAGQVESHIASDNISGGEMAGGFLAEAIDKAGQVVELQGIPDTSAAIERGQGFNLALEDYPDIEVIDRQVANFSREEGQQVFAEILAAEPQIDAVFAHNDEMILGAIDAAQQADRTGITFVGFDAIDDAIQALESGQLAATIAQQPSEMGRLGVETALSYLQGEQVPDSIPVDLALITR